MRKFSMNAVALFAVAMMAAVATAQPASFIDLGNIGLEGNYVFDTFGATSLTGDLDTELGIYDAAGNLLANNDDAGGPNGLQSLIDIDLTAGQYFLAVSEFNTIFNPNFDVTGGFEDGESATIPLNINGVLAGEAFPGTDNQVEFFGVTVRSNAIPEPATGMIVALCGLAGLTRRRRA